MNRLILISIIFLALSVSLKSIENNQNNINNYSNLFEWLGSGYKGFVEFGYQIGVGEESYIDHRINRLKLDFVNGFQLNKFIFIGLGSGLRYYENHSYNNNIAILKLGNYKNYSQSGKLIGQSNHSRLLIPFYSNLRIFFTNKIISPFISFSGGYSFYSDNFKGVGYLVNSSIGIKYKYTNISDIYISFGYDNQEIKGQFNDIPNEFIVSLHAIELNLGISF